MDKPEKITNLHFDDTIPDSLNIDDWDEECQNSCVNRGYNKGLAVSEAYNKSRELDANKLKYIINASLRSFLNKIFFNEATEEMVKNCIEISTTLSGEIIEELSKPVIKLPEKVENKYPCPSCGVEPCDISMNCERYRTYKDNERYNEALDLVAELNGEGK